MGPEAERPRPGEWIVPPGALRAKDIAIEPDLSNAAPFLAAAMIAGRAPARTPTRVAAARPATTAPTGNGGRSTRPMPRK